MICEVCKREIKFDWRKSKKSKRRRLRFCSPECARSVGGVFNKNKKKTIECNCCHKTIQVGKTFPEKDYLCLNCKKIKCLNCGKSINRHNKHSLCKNCLPTSPEYRKLLSNKALTNMKSGKIKPWQTRNILSYERSSLSKS